jgi:hypothetical protein
MVTAQTLNAKYPDWTEEIGVASMGSTRGTDDDAITASIAMQSGRVGNQTVNCGAGS